MDQVKRLVGNDSQLMLARRIALRDGMSEGLRAIELMNANGLYVTCMEDQCLNLYDFSYKGVNCAFKSKTGLQSNRFFNGGCNEFSYYFPAGMLYTCGLTNTGVGVTENGIYHAEHGRIGMMPARDVAMKTTDEGVVITGTVQDTLLCGHNLQLDREIFFPKAGKEIQIRDTVTNCEGIPAEMMLLYHCNFGYPLLTPKSRLVKGAGSIKSKLSDSVPDNYAQMSEPNDDKIEEVYYHKNSADPNGYGYAAIFNEELELGCYVKYKLDTLPLLVHWKNMCSHDYCIGLEPSNSYILGRQEERKQGTIVTMNPYETQTFRVSLGILDGRKELEEFESMVLNLRQENC